MTLNEGLPLLADPTSERVRANTKRQKQRRVSIALAAAVLLLMAGTLVAVRTQKPSAVSLLATTSPFAETVAKYRELHDVNAVVQVRINGTVVYDLAEGVADEEFNAPMTSDSIFPVGSNSKLFTAVSLYQLQERALVNLSEPVNQYLDGDDFAAFGFPNQTTWCPRVAGASPNSPCENITFVQLMHMGSGIGDSLNCDNVDAAHCYNTAEALAYYKGSIAAYVGMFINDPLVFKPDTNYSYANPNFVLLSYMVEKISGVRFEHYVQEHIFDKIGLKNTYYDPYSGGLGIRRGYVQQYTNFYVQPSPTKKGELLATGTCSPYTNSGTGSGTGGFRSTVSDMQRWYLDLFANQGTTSAVLTAASIRMLVERVNPINPAYAQGVGVAALREDGWPSRIRYCGGMKCATTCMNLLFPLNNTADTNSSVIVSAFSNHVDWGFATRSAFEAYRPSEFLITPPDDLTVNDDGAFSLLSALVEAYRASA
jgi:CubicO group peptidase (beta-lactamase class C family)